jgi:hypothetical protein
MFKKIFLISLIVLSFLSIEFYLHKSQKKNISEKPLFAVCTHTGERISEDGQLKFAIAPFTIYKNLPNQRTKEVTINARGFRGAEFSIIPDKRTRIIVVGGSNAFGSGVASDNETAVSIFGKLNPRYEVINAGVVGFASGQELAYIVTELADYHPRIIIAFDGWNDLHSQWYHTAWFPKQKTKDEMGYNSTFFSFQIEKKLIENYNTQVGLFSSFGRFFNVVVDKSLILSWLRKKVERLKQRLAYKNNANSAVSEYRGAASDDYFNAILETYTRNLIKMSDFCRSQGIKFIVVFQPELGLKINKNPEEQKLLANYTYGNSSYAKEFPALYKKFLEGSKDILKKSKIDYLDINSEAAFINDKKTLFIDAVHTNNNGNEIIAKTINDYIVNYPAAEQRGIKN